MEKHYNEIQKDAINEILKSRCDIPTKLNRITKLLKPYTMGNEYKINETNYAVQIAKTGNSWISVLCEVPIYPNSDMEQVRRIAKNVLTAINAHDELVKALQNISSLLDFAINATPTGAVRNLLTDANIIALGTIQKVSDTTPINQ